MGSGTCRGIRARLAVLAALSLVAAVRAWAAEPRPAATATAPGRPISMDKGPAGDLLRKWAAEGTAAGNVGDWYDNRDRGHSLLDTAPYPQLQVYKYTAEEKAKQADWALMTTVRPLVVFGNSSTSAPAAMGGSNPRTCYAVPMGLELLYRQYRGNNLYLYPAHQDFQVGHDGIGGAMYGDLFPANTPYVITSLGSSGTDQPFMKAVASTLAAFRPEVKAKLVAEGLLMPTVQMIFRMSNKVVKEEKDYLSCKAHRVVFDGGAVDALKMVQMAHQIDTGHIPPLAEISVVQEDPVEAGRDYVDPFRSEAIGTTPCAVARVFRGVEYRRRMVVSASESVDVNHLPLTFTWVVLEGDPEKVKIKTLDKAGAKAEITIDYHERAPIEAGSALETNRVDVGLFASNGTYWSAPALVTSFSLDNEARTYDADGRVLEVGYGMGEMTIGVANWGAFFGGLKEKEMAAGMKVLTEGWKEADVAALREVGAETLAAAAKADELDRTLKETEEAAAKAAPQIKRQLDETAKQTRAGRDEAVKIRDALLSQKQSVLGQAIRPWVQGRLRELMMDPGFYAKYGARLGALGAGAEAERKKLLGYGIAQASGGQGLAWVPVLAGDRPAAERLTRYERMMIGRFNGEVLAGAIAGVRAEFHANLVDFRLTIPKIWRDVYHYSPTGSLLGWTRDDGSAATEFSARGEIVEARDEQGRALKVRSVEYERKTPGTFNPRTGPDMTPMSFRGGPRVFVYRYEGKEDYAGMKVEVTGAETQGGGGK